MDTSLAPTTTSMSSGVPSSLHDTHARRPTRARRFMGPASASRACRATRACFPTGPDGIGRLEHRDETSRTDARVVEPARDAGHTTGCCLERRQNETSTSLPRLVASPDDVHRIAELDVDRACASAAQLEATRAVVAATGDHQRERRSGQRLAADGRSAPGAGRLATRVADSCTSRRGFSRRLWSRTRSRRGKS